MGKFKKSHTMKYVLLSISIVIFLSCTGQSKKSDINETKKVLQADKLVDEKKYKEALNLLKEINSLSAKYLTGCSLLGLKDYEESIIIFKAVYEKDPSYKNTCFNIAKCYLEKTEWFNYSIDKTETTNLIIKLLTEGISLKSGEIPDSYLAQYYANRGQMLQFNSDFENAILDFSKAIELDAQGDYYSARAMTYHFMDKNVLACEDFKMGRELGEKYNEEEIKKICP